jgi:hypothetical protein
MSGESSLTAFLPSDLALAFAYQITRQLRAEYEDPEDWPIIAVGVPHNALAANPMMHLDELALREYTEVLPAFITDHQLQAMALIFSAWTTAYTGESAQRALDDLHKRGGPEVRPSHDPRRQEILCIGALDASSQRYCQMQVHRSGEHPHIGIPELLPDTALGPAYLSLQQALGRTDG